MPRAGKRGEDNDFKKEYLIREEVQHSRKAASPQEVPVKGGVGLPKGMRK